MFTIKYIQRECTDTPRRLPGRDRGLSDIPPGSPLWHPLGTGHTMLALRLPGNPLTNAIHYGNWRRRLGISECKIVPSFGRGDRIGELRIGLGG